MKTGFCLVYSLLNLWHLVPGIGKGLNLYLWMNECTDERMTIETQLNSLWKCALPTIKGKAIERCLAVLQMCFTLGPALTPPTAVFKANMGENFFFYLGFLQREECWQSNLREFPGVESRDGSSSPSNLTQEPLTTGERWQFQVGVLSVSDEHSAEMCEETGQDFPQWVEGSRTGVGVRDPSIDSFSLCDPGQSFPSEPQVPHTMGWLKKSL